MSQCCCSSFRENLRVYLMNLSLLYYSLKCYRSSGVTGVIKTNGYPRDVKQFNKLSTYIMQEDLLQPHLTVHEAMCIAANLKLGNDYSALEKLAAVSQKLYLLVSHPADSANRVPRGPVP